MAARVRRVRRGTEKVSAVLTMKTFKACHPEVLRRISAANGVRLRDPWSTRCASSQYLRMTILAVVLLVSPGLAADQQRFDGRHFSGEGDVAYVEMLETSRRMFQPDPRWQNLSMLYEPKWN